MMHRDINKAVNQAFTKATPNVLSAVLSDCGEQKGTVIVMTEKRNLSWGKRIAAMAAILMLIIGMGAIIGIHYTNNTAVSTISLDVNPSIEITVNRHQRVLEVKARNMDAKIIMGDMELQGSDLEVAVNAIIGSMLRYGYITELANSILISVDSKDANQAAALQEKLTAEVQAMLRTESFSGAVISQTINPKTELEQKAEQFGITLGKAQLVEKIAAQDDRYSFEDLAKLNINELNLLCQSAEKPAEDVSTVGTPSEKKYIGTEAALAAAMAHAGLDAAAFPEYEMDVENGVMVYEIEFRYGDYKYEYDIDATTGAVLKSEKEKDDDTEKIDPPDSVTLISQEEAQNIALHACNVTKEQTLRLWVGMDSATVYKIRFEANDYQYELEIDGITGKVLDVDKEVLTPPDSDNTLGPITRDDALNAALTHAGITGSSITDVEVEQDTENGKLIYEVSFKAGGYEYDYKIDAFYATVLKFEKEPDDDRNDVPVDTANILSKDEAVKIALAHALKSQVTELEAELDEENGKAVYEISFKAEGLEYDYEIDAKTGAVLKSEKELDD